MASLMAPIGEDGKLQTHTTSGDSLTQKSKKNNSTVDSDMFLSLLVAEMQNQDPLEPTSNTEWVSQYATFTQVTKMTEMSESIDLLRANEMIGKTAVMKVTSESTGEVTYAQGVVDYVIVEEGKPLLVIGENKYALSDLDSVMSKEYEEAYDMYTQFKAMIDALPSVKYGDKSYKNVIQGAYDYYNSMNDYQKNFMKHYATEQMLILAEWKKKMEQWGVDIETEPKEEEEDKGTTLDDVLESFNTKMDAILDKLKLLSTTITENTGNQKPEGGNNNTTTPGTDETKPGDGNNSTTTPGTDETKPGDGDNSTTTPDAGSGVVPPQTDAGSSADTDTTTNTV